MAPLTPVDRVRVTTVVDNYIDALRQDEKVARRYSAFVARQMVDLRAEHGLAHFVEITRGAETVRIAFDSAPPRPRSPTTSGCSASIRGRSTPSR